MSDTVYYTTLITMDGTEITVECPEEDFDEVCEDIMKTWRTNDLFYVKQISDKTTATFKNTTLEIIDMKKIIGRQF